MKGQERDLQRKRIFDVCVSLFALLFFAPLFLWIAVWIKVTSEGPVFFLQSRLGKEGKEFKILKFRTMVVNAEQLGTGLKVEGDFDERITKAGHFLRRTSLDELPQLLNVLYGDMSLVGPRPPATYHPYEGYERYPEWAKKRFAMRPGITGLAQVKVRNSATWEERIRYDVKYVERFHLALDMRILFCTVRQVIKKENIYAEKQKHHLG
ncbi:MAG: sugar transferase [Lachnospiraceae bacterium]|nr:sugar transferase [Lachnospiraceae bacterium]